MSESKKQLNLDILEGLRELQSETDPHFIKRYFETFLGEFPVRIEGMKKSITAGDYKKLATEAHALKSSCMNSGVEGLSRVCEDLENRGRNGQSMEGAMADVVQVENLYSLLKNEVQALPEYR